MSEAVAPLAELLDGPDVDGALEALQAIGPGARSVLPRLAALSKRMHATCTKPVDPARLLGAVDAIATRPEDAGVALQTIAALLPCDSTFGAVAEALVRRGTDGRNVLLQYFRDEENTIQSRLVVEYVLERSGAKLDHRD